jgi:nucleoside-diphosphate-sugar epimerase
MDVFIVGCGYVGKEIAKRMQNADYSVAATTRRPESARQLAEQGIQAFAYDWLSDDRLPEVGKVENLIIAVSHAAIEGIPPQQTHVRGLENLVRQLSPRPRRVIYLSTTGVMANTSESEWVDEESSVAPQRPGSIAAWQAEKWLHESNLDSELIVLRLAGVYGPNRIPNLESLRQQQPLSVDPYSYLNLIHVTDIAGIVEQACQQTHRRNLYMVSDGHAVQRREYYEWIYQHAQLPRPIFAEIPNEGGRGTGNKRVSNRRLVEDFDYTFRFPSYREGLMPLIVSEG